MSSGSGFCVAMGERDLDEMRFDIRSSDGETARADAPHAPLKQKLQIDRATLIFAEAQRIGAAQALKAETGRTTPIRAVEERTVIRRC